MTAASSPSSHEGEVDRPRAIEFDHGLAEIITAVMDAGLDLVAIEEHDSVPWPALEDQMLHPPRRVTHNG